ncbi:oligoribonuclease [Pradoshia eiseniae]|uniref:Oligoribonuclease n=1 Tax=Pradoshia eiseniae TaxID=2064768 RepID=A0A2S7N431_9BACI|nr:DHHA1 domain-containing protein [Pradoshia eiseniae]PQD96735.1 oligoribonuclease [Pradoshia eiseniae]
MYKLLTHNDLDGVGCGILARIAFGDRVKVRYNSIASLNREIESFLEEDSDTYLFITDMSPNEENEKKLQERFASKGMVQLIDHHKTAEHLNEYEWGFVLSIDEEGKGTSATSLFYDYLIRREFLQPAEGLTDFVELIRQYDTWEWEKNENERAHRLNSLLYLTSIDEFEERMVERLQGGELFSFDDFEEKVLGMEYDKMERYLRRKKREVVQTEVSGQVAGVVYAESYLSELGSELGKEFAHLDYIAIMNMGGRRISFRTIHDDIDVSEIAAKHGGGGHAKAAGCSLTEEAYKEYVAKTFPLAHLREDAKRNHYNVKQSSFGTLYHGSKNDTYLLYPKGSEWRIDHNDKVLEIRFKSLDEGERYLKRTHAAWLVRDDEFVEYLMKRVPHRG